MVQCQIFWLSIHLSLKLFASLRSQNNRLSLLDFRMKTVLLGRELARQDYCSWWHIVAAGLVSPQYWKLHVLSSTILIYLMSRSFEGIPKISNSHKCPLARKSLVKGERFSRENASEPELNELDDIRSRRIILRTSDWFQDNSRWSAFRTLPFCTGHGTRKMYAKTQPDYPTHETNFGFHPET